ncbi:hypothetical protein AMJ83_03745 [candidate division WOR_3 bacterium SM23_42]|uniref:PatA-like N-terminal domain-containing protein n=1 Tax=candidate division WOR_3 bacterium SM23_42 TaxID=1703779 RepID=A0A0S8FTQ0_UNCW3|nr:MAG: hypothetical protein AMJ83_03745 [candidate division WOR_3 bacterium SM23_42]
MAIKGSLGEASLPDVIQLLTYSLKSGCLSVTDGRNFGNIFLRDGRVIYATILNRRMRIGDTMLEKKLFDQTIMDRAVGIQKTKKKRIGEILVEMGAISRVVLEKELRQQIEETILTMLTWETGYFNFEEGLLPSSAEYTIELSAQELLLKGARRIQEWQKIESKLPPFETVLVKREDIPDLKLTEQESMVLSLIDGDNSVDRVIKISGLDFREACKVVNVLLTAGVIEKPKKPAEKKPMSGDMSERKNRGFAFYKTALYDEAEREFAKVIEHDADNAEALFYLGLIALIRHHNEVARDNLQKALEKESRLSVLIALGYVCGQMKLYEDALTYLQRAHELAPDNAKVMLNLGITRYRMGDLEGAATILEESLECSEGIVLPYLYLFLINVMRDDTDKAIDWLKGAIDKFPRLAALKNNLAVLYQSSGKYEEAEKLYRQVLNVQPGETVAIKNLAKIFLGLGIYGAARECYEQMPAAERDPLTLKNLGRIYLLQGDRERALNTWEQAHELDPDDDDVVHDLQTLRSVKSK